MTLKDVTDSKRNVGRPEAEPDSGGKIRNRASARADACPRDGATGSDSPSIPLGLSATPRMRTLRDGLWGWLRGVGARLHASSPYTGRPESIRDVVRYTLAGGWIPGEHPWWVEAPGYLYGFLIAIPAAIVGNIILWITHRPSREIMFWVACGLLSLVGYGWLWQTPMRWIGYLFLWLAGVR